MNNFNEEFYNGVKLFHQVFGHPCPDNIFIDINSELIDLKRKCDVARDFKKLFPNMAQPYINMGEYQVDRKLSAFRHKLLLEEFEEFDTAVKNNDKNEILDGLADMLYVSYGALIAFGFSFEEIISTDDSYFTTSMEQLIKTEYSFPKKYGEYDISEIKMYYVNAIKLIINYCNINKIEIHPIFMEVQRSNMSKVCQNLEEANQTIEKYKQDKRYNAEIKVIMNKYVVFNKDDGKILKSINFSNPDLSKYI